MTEIVELESSGVVIEQVVSHEQIKAMIAQLSVTEDGEPLKGAMSDLKKALKANPAACALLLPEDIGAMVSVLKKITGKDIEEAMAGKKKSTKVKAKEIHELTEAEQQEILDDIMP